MSLVRGTASFSLFITQQAKGTEAFMVSSEEAPHLVSFLQNKRRDRGLYGLVRGTASFSLFITKQAKGTEDFMVSSEEPTHLVSLSHNKRRGPRTIITRILV